MTQWRIAAQHPPHLTAIAPYVPIYPGWDIPNTNGIPQAWTTVILGLVSGRQLDTASLQTPRTGWGRCSSTMPPSGPSPELDEAMGIAADDWWMSDARGKRLSFLKMWLDHVGDEAFNLAAEPRAQDYTRMDFPVLTVTGFFDDDQPGTLRYYRGYVAHAPAAAVRRHFFVIGPWNHGGTQKPSKETDGLAVADAAVLDMTKLQRILRLGAGARAAARPPPQPRFVFHDGRRRVALCRQTSRPRPRARRKPSSCRPQKGTPEDVFHSGRLLPKAPAAEPPAMLVSDPRELPELEVAKNARAEDLTSQFRAFQKRALDFHSEPFERDTEVAGHIRLTLIVQADAPDFDLWAQLLVVFPDGSAVHLGEDIRRARFRHSPFRQELLKPEEVVEIPFEFLWTARRIPAGARLRLTVAPLNSPNYQKNYNSGGRMGYETLKDARTAHIRLFHDGAHASRLMLPLAAPPASSAP